MPSDEELAETVARAALDVGIEPDDLVKSPTVSVVPPTRQGIDTPDALVDELRDADEAAPALELHDAIGKGGMGVVWRATQTRLAREVAVKIVRPDLEDRVDSTLKLLREAWVTGALEHPNIVPVHDLGVDSQGRASIVLKRIEGDAWSALMHDAEAVESRFGETGLLGWNLGIFLAVANAVRFAHNRGILHRDLKPENVMVGSFGEVYVLDWGIAVSIGDDLGGRFPRANEASHLAGTPAYMAPEMLGGRADELGPATDVYLLGAILYEIVTGLPPHLGETLGKMVGSIMLSAPPLSRDVPDELQRIIRRAMSAAPTSRYPGVEGLSDAVRGFIAHEGSRLLAAEAAERLEELRATLASPEADNVAIAQTLAACSFGFRHALSRWPGNTAASDGLRSAAVAMAEFELARDAPEAAARHLAEIDDAPAALRDQVEGRLRAKERERQALEKLSRDHAMAPGWLPRRTLGLAVAVFFCVGPLFSAWLADGGVRTDHLQLGLTGLVTLLLLAVFVWRYRGAMLATRVNRIVVGAFAVAFAGQALIHLGDALAGIDAFTSARHQTLVFGVVTAMGALYMGRLLWVPALTYAAAFVVSSLVRESFHYAVFVSNMVLLVSLIRLLRAPPSEVAGADPRRPS